MNSLIFFGIDCTGLDCKTCTEDPALCTSCNSGQYLLDAECLDPGTGGCDETFAFYQNDVDNTCDGKKLSW